MTQYTQLNLQDIPAVRQHLPYQRVLTREEHGLLLLGFTPQDNYKDYLAFCHKDTFFIFNQHTKQYIAHMVIKIENSRYCLKFTEINGVIKKQSEHMKNYLQTIVDHILNYNYINS
jgi:hypothetical protein